MYLAGYAAECMAKAYLISMHAPLNTLGDVDAKLRRTEPSMPNLLSASDHSIEAVLRFTDLAAEQNDQQRRAFGFIASEWSTDLGYNGRAPKADLARRLVADCRKLHDWIAGRL